MASKEQLRKVAQRCSHHRYIFDDSKLKSSVNDSGYVEKSCENCAHFTSDHKCDIGLTDKILSNMAMEVDYNQWK